MHITPPIAQNNTDRASSVDPQTTRHAGYEVSQRKRKRVEKSFVLDEDHRNAQESEVTRVGKGGWLFTFVRAAYKLSETTLSNEGCTTTC